MRTLNRESYMHFGILRGALGSMPRGKYMELKGLLTEMEPAKAGEGIPEGIMVLYIHKLIAGLEECFCLLRDMKNAGEIILTADGSSESEDRALAMDAEGMRGSLFTHLRNIQQGESAIGNSEAE